MNPHTVVYLFLLTCALPICCAVSSSLISSSTKSCPCFDESLAAPSPRLGSSLVGISLALRSAMPPPFRWLFVDSCMLASCLTWTRAECLPENHSPVRAEFGIQLVRACVQIERTNEDRIVPDRRRSTDVLDCGGWLLETELKARWYMVSLDCASRNCCFASDKSTVHEESSLFSLSNFLRSRRRRQDKGRRIITT